MLLRILHDATADAGTPTTRLQGRPPGIKRPISKFDGQPVYDFREAVLNKLGYRVLRGGVVDVELAINIFRLNTVGYPESFNTWDSLAEGYMENGDFMNAVKFYEKSLELNPNNRNAVEMLERISEPDD